MDKENKESTSLRGTRGSRANRMSAISRGGRQLEKSPSPKSNQPKKESPKPEPSEPNKVEKNPRKGSKYFRRENGQIQRRNHRIKQSNRYTKRLERAQNAARYQRRGQRGRFRARSIYYNIRRRPFGRRSIYISGLPKNVNRYRLSTLLQQEGRLIRCTLLRDRFGNSRGIAFAEMQNPRDAAKIIQKWRGRIVDGNTIFVTFKRNPNKWNYYQRNNNRYRNNRQYNNYGGYNSRYQRSYRPRGNRGRPRGRGRGF
jgi:RNA recognition motif-containing protein